MMAVAGEAEGKEEVKTGPRAGQVSLGKADEPGQGETTERGRLSPSERRDAA